MEYQKVNYSEYEGKYDERIKERMETAPESVDIETMRENLYGYTFTKEYAEGEILDELSMDYWRDRDIAFFDDFFDTSAPDIDEVLLPEDAEGPYFFPNPQEELLLKAIDSTGDGLTPETALCVIDVSQEYEYIERVVRYCTMRVVQQSVRDGIDCLELQDEDGNRVKLYFNVKRRFDVGYK